MYVSLQLLEPIVELWESGWTKEERCVAFKDTVSERPTSRDGRVHFRRRSEVRRWTDRYRTRVKENGGRFWSPLPVNLGYRLPPLLSLSLGLKQFNINSFSSLLSYGLFTVGIKITSFVKINKYVNYYRFVYSNYF